MKLITRARDIIYRLRHDRLKGATYSTGFDASNGERRIEFNIPKHTRLADSIRDYLDDTEGMIDTTPNDRPRGVVILLRIQE